MYAYTLAHATGRTLVLHRLRVRAAAKPGSRGQAYKFYPWRKFFDMRRLNSGPVKVLDFDEWAAASLRQQDDRARSFSIDVVLHMVELLEGKRDEAAGTCRVLDYYWLQL
eukprot:SAG31_NODE_4609_length_3098_cov_2.056019_2_plen_110_part_00